jgi:hypothetical protein
MAIIAWQGVSDGFGIFEGEQEDRQNSQKTSYQVKASRGDPRTESWEWLGVVPTNSDQKKFGFAHRRRVEGKRNLEGPPLVKVVGFDWLPSEVAAGRGESR